MAYDWMPGVLEDLARFARANGFDRLAEEVEKCTDIARSELAARAEAGVTGTPVAVPHPFRG